MQTNQVSYIVISMIRSGIYVLLCLVQEGLDFIYKESGLPHGLKYTYILF